MDGWRAVSIIIVLANHSTATWGFPHQLDTLFFWSFDGILGVRFFFVISGFLITWLMMLESAKDGHVNLYHFYARRALRILPVYGLFLCTLFGLQLFTNFHQSLSSWISNLTFTTNFNRPPWTSCHLWSLAVEEQFYILWPILFVFWGPSASVRRLITILAIPLFLAPLCRAISHLGVFPRVLYPLFQDYSFFYNCDALAIGCFCAIIVGHRNGGRQNSSISQQWIAIIVGTSFILIPNVLTRVFQIHSLNFLMVPLGDTFQDCGFGLLLIQNLDHPRFCLYRCLNWKWVQQIGILSYSIYIWQMIFCTSPKTYGIQPVWWLSFPGWLIPVFVVGGLSYYVIERPFFALRAYFRKA